MSAPFRRAAILGTGLIGGSDFLLYIVIVTAVLSLLVRYRGAGSIERQQLKWFAVFGVIGGLALVIAVVDRGSTNSVTLVSTWAFVVAEVALTLLPIAIGIAVLRYRLYEIDRLVSRTISWLVVSGLIGALFVGFVLALQAILVPLTRSNELAVAGSTLLVFALFAPIRRRVQSLVDRRFNRGRYDAERTVAAFAGRMRDEVDLDALRIEILATVTSAVEPTTVSLWLRE